MNLGYFLRYITYYFLHYSMRARLYFWCGSMWMATVRAVVLVAAMVSPPVRVMLYSKLWLGSHSLDNASVHRARALLGVGYLSKHSSTPIFEILNTTVHGVAGLYHSDFDWECVPIFECLWHRYHTFVTFGLYLEWNKTE